MQIVIIVVDTVISIHALLAESDVVSSAGTMGKSNFYPRSPCGERQHTQPPGQAQSLISIHALLAESDRSSGTFEWNQLHFYPRSPCGERL